MDLLEVSRSAESSLLILLLASAWSPPRPSWWLASGLYLLSKNLLLKLLKKVASSFSSLDRAPTHPKTFRRADDCTIHPGTPNVMEKIHLPEG